MDEYKFYYCDNCDGDQTADTVEAFVQNLRTLLKQYNGLPESKDSESTLNESLVAFDFRRHLYAPLIFLKANGLQLTVSPVSLNDDEKKFIDKLKRYLEGNAGVFEGKDLFLLRNKSKAGMGFFEAGNFYPDYVLWVDTPEAQYISFIDPKGLRHLGWDDPKITFCHTIKKLETRLQSSSPDKRIVLNSFIISGTPHADLFQWWGKGLQELRARNVFCLDDPYCVEKMIHKILLEPLENRGKEY